MIISNANSCVNDNTNNKNNQQEKTGYLYRHIRLDTNMPFYIGISTINDEGYTRAYSKNSRSKEWNEVVDNTEYRVEILLKDIPIDLLGNKEKYFIKLYGRIDRGTGTLVNKTSGGQGANGHNHTEETKDKIGESKKGKIHSLETRKKQSVVKKGKKHTEETRRKMSEFHKGNKYNLGRKLSEEHIDKIRQSNKGKTTSEATKEKQRKANTGKRHTEESKNKMSEANKGKKHTKEAKMKIGESSKGNKYNLGKKRSKETRKKMSDKKPKKRVGQYKDGNLIKEYPSIESTKLDGFDPSSVSKCCHSKLKTHKGYTWTFLLA